MTLTAFDTHGKPFVRALLQDEATTADTLLAVTHLLKTGGASFTLFDVTHELGIRLPLAAVTETIARPARHAPPRKCRAA